MSETAHTKQPEQPSAAELTLKPARLDFLSTQTQMVFASIIALLVILASWAGTLDCGFLLDDFLHIDYVSRALSGDWHDLLSNFYSNWAGSDIMKSYRPLVSLSLFIDYLIWGANSWGFHLTNILMLIVCSIFSGLITLELTGLNGNRMRAIAAIWVALLFAIYPLHAESTAWIIGRVDLLCTMFYLISIFCYLRFRLLREKQYFLLSLIAFVASVFSKEPGVTVPVVITSAELLLREHTRVSMPAELQRVLKAKRTTAVLTFWFVLGILFSLRFLFLGTMVGGYGNNSNPLLSLSNFLDRESLMQILYPINLDMIARTGEYAQTEGLKKILSTAYLLILITGLSRLVTGFASRKIVLFLLIWIAVSVLPAFQIWHLSPNLVGSRLFFLGSAPAIMLLVLLALPSIDTLKPVFARIYSCTGAVALFSIVCIWSYWLQIDILPWRHAGSQVSSFIKSVQGTINSSGAEKRLLVLNLPTDYSGAGMITRPQYLGFTLRPPFASTDQSSRVETIEPLISDSHDYMWPNRFLQSTSSDKFKTFIWKESSDGQDAHLEQWKANREAVSDRTNEIAAEKGSFAVPIAQRISEFKYIPNLTNTWSGSELAAPLPVNKESEWTLSRNDGQKFELRQGSLIIQPGATSGLTLIFPDCKIDPQQLAVARLAIRTISGTAPTLELSWCESDSNAATNASKLQARSQASVPIILSGNEQTLWLGRHRRWTLSKQIQGLALKVPPGHYVLELNRLELFPQEKFCPALSVSADQDYLLYDISKIDSAASVKLIVLSPNMSFDAAHGAEIAAQLSSQSGTQPLLSEVFKLAPANYGEGKISIEKLGIEKPGIYHARIQAIDTSGREIGLPSEPVIIKRKDLAK